MFVQNGSLSSLPFIGRFIGAILSAYVADNLLIKGYLSTTVTRKLFQTIGEFMRSRTWGNTTCGDVLLSVSDSIW